MSEEHEQVEMDKKESRKLKRMEFTLSSQIQKLDVAIVTFRGSGIITFRGGQTFHIMNIHKLESCFAFSLLENNIAD